MFLNATMLAGIAGAMLPLVLHLWHRARYRSVEWGAMLFLGDETRHFGQARLKELILLFVRMGFVALLAVTLARPVLSPAAAGPQDEPACMVILFDRSASMAMTGGGLPRLEAARRAALGALSSLRPGDEAAIVLLPDYISSLGLTTTDLQFLASRVNDVRAAPGRADISAGLTTAARIFSRSRAATKQLVLICDRQASSWREVSNQFAQAWQQSERDSNGQLPKFTVIPVGGTDTGNIAVESVQLVNPPVIRDVAAELEIRVRNFDTVPAVGVPLTVTSPAGELYRATLNLPANTATTVRCSVRFTKSGSQTLTASLGSEGMSLDDQMDLAVDVADPIRVLLISGDQPDASAEPFSSEADFALLALAPYAAAGRSGPDPAEVRVVPADAWPELDRSRERVVILANVARFTPQQVRQIEQYVYGGGGLLVAPGNLSRSSEYNRRLWRDGAGVLPAALDSPTPADGSQATSLSGLELSHPIFRFLQGREDPLPSVTIGRYFPVRTTEPRGKVLGRYASGAPFLVEGTYGHGRVLLMSTSLDADWSTLPLTNLYLPMLQSSVRYLAAGLTPDRNVSPGEPLVEAIDADHQPKATVDGPAMGPNQPAELLRTSEGFEARWTNTVRPGLYTMTVESDRGNRRAWFVVRQPRDESDVTSLTSQRWNQLQRMLNFDVSDSDPQAVTETMTQSRLRRELWAYLLPCVIALGLVEMALARWWMTPPRGEGSS